jgi:hypothetical protein
MNKKYDLMLQCPQLYIYIVGWIVDAVHVYKMGTRGDVIRSIIAGLISVIFLMYISYCNWGEYQWLTTVHATLVVLVILAKLYVISYTSAEEKEIILA